MSLSRKLLFFPFFAAGIAILVIAVKSQKDLPVEPISERARIVDVIPLERTSIAPTVIGYGQLRPKTEWKAIAEVTGQVLYRHPDLEKGKIVEAGTQVLRIDPIDYELQLAQAEADLSKSKTSLTKLTLENTNLKQTIKIEESRLKLSENELSRIQNLVSRGLASQSDVDSQQQSYLAQQKLVQDMRNTLTLYPEERSATQAAVHVSQANVDQAKNLLDKTSITLPATMRVSTVDIEINQVVNMQQTMFVGHSIEAIEVEAQLSIHDLQTIASSAGAIAAVGNPQAIPNLDKMSAVVTLSSGQLTAEYQARVARLSDTVDVNQATVGVILEIDQDLQTNLSEGKPLLVNGMFVKASITGAKQDLLMVPERALHGDRIYLMDDNGKLDIRQVTVLYRQDGQVVIEGDVTTGDMLVLNDLLPAVEGMALRAAEGDQL
ncbi:efflux RND transporter periplasmic adaptor subunit [Vibrio ulleungensis]|uniref:HlyD family secretion protein n=1 Tax=Vibrio ulleungensis TaxID=2807619 RepID=A0ABS2HK02_9VIBR|nr:HlyD family secretion protein [Vibrio ulleungensis]MBM7037374.1 HlyD family secretion protein [Vibrio ulleungensis]